MPAVTRDYDFQNLTVADADQVDSELNKLFGAINALDVDNLAASLLALLFKPGDIIWTAAYTRTGALPADGAAVSRSTYADLFAATTIARTGDTTNASAVVTGLAKTSDLRAGMKVEGSGIPAATSILSVDSPTQVTLTANATATAVAAALRFFPHGNGDGSTTFNTPDVRRRVVAGTDEATANPSGANDGLAVGSRSVQHVHTMAHDHTTPNHTHVGGGAGSTDGAHGATGAGQTYATTANPVATPHTHDVNTIVTIPSSGGGTTGASSAANTGSAGAAFLLLNAFIKT